MSKRYGIVLCGFLGLSALLVSVAESGAQHGGMHMMQKKGMMGKGMGMMDCCGMMGGGKKDHTDHVHKMTMDCCKKDKGELCDMLKSDKAEERFAAAIAIGEKGLPLTADLIQLLTDKSDPVRQAARRSLILTSYHLNTMKNASKKGARATYVDFGPVPNANPMFQQQSAKAWAAWASKNATDLKKLEELVAPTETSAQGTGGHSKDSLDKVKTALKNQKAILLDVREQAEWEDGHLKAAQLLPLSKLKDGIPSADLAKLLPKDKTIYAHCGSGKRVLQAAEILHRAGYHIEPLKGGYVDLLKAGFEKAK
jgi:phage shock protein E